MKTGLISALNPQSQQIITADASPAQRSRGFSALAPRLDTLNGKTVYLVDTGFGGSYKFLDQMQQWLAQHMPAVKTVRRRKPGFIFRDDTNDLWKEIKEKGDAAILGVAG
jgi:hypothetical protein